MNQQLKPRAAADAALEELAGEARDNGNSSEWVDAQTAIVRAGMVPPVPLVPAVYEADYSDEIASAVRSVLAYYREAGYIVRVEQAPNQPLAMRNDRDVVTVYRRQVPA